MKLGILSRGKSLYSTKRLFNAARSRDHDVRVIDYTRCYMNITSADPRVIYQGEELDFDAIIPRIGATYTFYGSAVVRQFELMNVFASNGSQAITRSRDKLRSLQILARDGLGLPITSFCHSTKDVDGVIREVGGAPLVVKLTEGTQGTGVVLAETTKAAESLIAAFKELEANILVQEFIKESGGSDVRAFVVGDEVVAAMKRTAASGDFRSNLHRGGKGESVELTDDEAYTAVRAAKLMGLRVAGVDILQSSRGPLVIEVNSSPGLEGIEKFTGVDVATKIIEYIESRVEEHDTVDSRDV